MDYVKMCAGSTALLKKSMIALTLVLALFAVSCKTVKTATQTALSQQTEQNNDLTQHIATQTDAQTSFKSSDTSTTNTEVDEVVEETTWSVPDSTGTQHPVKTTKTHRHIGSAKQNNVQTTSGSETHAVTQSDVNDNTKTKTSTDEQTESKTTTKTSTPAWVVWIIIGIFAVILIVVLVLLRHYRIL